MRSAAVGALLGLGLAAGLLMVAAWLAARRPARLNDRIRPHVTGGPGETPGFARSIRMVTIGWIGHDGPRGLRGRLAQAGSGISVGQFRVEQVACAVGAAVTAATVGVLVAASTQGLIVLASLGAVTGAFVRQWRLTHHAHERSRRVEAQLPAAAELLAFALAAGESPHGALVRVSSSMSGSLAAEFDVVVDDVRMGVGLEAALRAMSQRCGSPAVSRFVDGMLVAVERGTPISEVMRAQAADVQADSRRRLMTLAGRKDVAMLVPVVFLILPTVVVVALFPGLQSLRLVTP